MKTKKLIVGFLTGAVAGLTAGLLFAPASGRKLQKQISKNARHLGKDLREKTKDSIHSLRTRYNTAVDHVGNQSKESFNKLKV
jgi:gas vesicle protein